MALPLKFSSLKYYTNYPHYEFDENLKSNRVTAKNFIPLTAKRGEVYLVDTSRLLHCGSRTNK